MRIWDVLLQTDAEFFKTDVTRVKEKLGLENSNKTQLILRSNTKGLLLIFLFFASNQHLFAIFD